ncbi:hypothetical protein V8F20_004141 [Naviculisporaceae sp. PSN 640]
MHFSTIILVISSSLALATPLHAEHPNVLEARSGGHDALEARACSGRKDWQGGGCELNWGGDCIERCRAQASSHGCSGCTVRRTEDSSGCAWGWQTCECICD